MNASPSVDPLVLIVDLPSAAATACRPALHSVPWWVRSKAWLLAADPGSQSERPTPAVRQNGNPKSAFHAFLCHQALMHSLRRNVCPHFEYAALPDNRVFRLSSVYEAVRVAFIANEALCQSLRAGNEGRPGPSPRIVTRRRHGYFDAHAAGSQVDWGSGLRVFFRILSESDCDSNSVFLPSSRICIALKHMSLKDFRTFTVLFVVPF